MAGPGNDKGNSSPGCCDKPPPLSVKMKMLEDLPDGLKHWSTDYLPVDILLLTMEDCEFLACYYYLRDSFKSYETSIGYVYFGKMGVGEDKSLKVALVKCYNESLNPGGSQTAVKNAATLLRPKAAFLVGVCYSPSPEKAQRGDVVISAKLTTYFYKTPVGKDFGNLVRNAADGWKAPLENQEARKVKVHCDGEILSCSDLNSAEQQCQLHPGAIAVEIGGKGLFGAAYDSKMEWLVVKGVCDFIHGSGSANDSWKTFACVMAASVVSYMLKNSFVFEDWPHYGDNSAGERSCKSDGPPANKYRRLAEPLDVEKCQEQLKSYYDTFSKVKTVPWDDSSSIHIEEIYTPLSWVRDHRKPGGVIKEELEDYTDMFMEDEYDRKPTRILVYGWPGIGKSTFCKRAAYDWSNAPKEILINFHILLLIKLQDVCNLEDIHDVLTMSKLLASDGPISVDSLCNYISNNQDKVLLILDGYDEYSCAKEHSPILKIWKGEQLRDCHVIITTRQIKCDKLRGPSHVQIEIHGFKSSEQIETFASKFLTDEQDLKEFMCYLKEKDLLDMAEIPLLLLMLCLVWIEKYHVGLPTSRADIYNSFIQTMLSHMTERSNKSEPVTKMSSKSLEKDLSMIGKFAFESLLEEVLFISCSKLPNDISSSLETLLQGGLFQIVNITSLYPEKGIFFIHKSVQEFLAAWHVKEEVLSVKDESSMSLSKVDSFKKCGTMLEVLKFASELSVEAAYAVLHHLAAVGRKESLSEFKFSEPLQSTEDLSEDQQQYLKLISPSFFCCSAEKRRDLFSMFITLTGGILLLDANQVNIVANEHLLKCDVIPEFIFFSYEKRNSEESHRDLITVAKDTNAVVVSCTGEMDADDCLTKWPRRPLNEYFLRKERKVVLHVCQIRKEKSLGTFPTKMLRELMSSTAESTQEKHLGDPLNEHDNETASRSTGNSASIIGRTPHSLSCVRNIIIYDMERQEMADLLPFSTSLRDIVISGKPFEAQFTEALVSRVMFSERLDRLSLQFINLTAKPAAVIARSLYQAPSLRVLNLSLNPLGDGVSVLSRHLSCVPHLKALLLYGVKMTKKQVNDLSVAVRHSDISELRTEYHDHDGNVKPEEKWPTDEDWRRKWKYWHGSEEEPDPGSVTNSVDAKVRKTPQSIYEVPDVSQNPEENPEEVALDEQAPNKDGYLDKQVASTGTDVPHASCPMAQQNREEAALDEHASNENGPLNPQKGSAEQNGSTNGCNGERKKKESEQASKVKPLVRSPKPKHSKRVTRRSSKYTE